MNSGKLLQIVQGHEATVNQIVPYDFSARVVSVSSDRTIRLWDLSDCSEVARFTCDSAVLSCVVVPGESDEAPLIFAGDASGRLHSMYLESPQNEIELNRDNSM